MSNTVSVNLPGKFCAWFDGTGLVQMQDDEDPDCRETRIAYADGRRIPAANQSYYIRLQATSTVLRLLAEYAGYCLSANDDCPDKAEQNAARKVLARVAEAQQSMKEKQ